MKQAKRVQMTAVVTTTKTSGALDEIVIGDWLHLELMDEAIGHYFLRVGQYTFDVIVPHTGTSIETRLQCAPLSEEEAR